MQLVELPLWAEYLLYGILIFSGISASAVVLTRLRYNPYLAFLILIPYVQLAALWVLAFSLWQRNGRRF